jgi:hypothetical protein
MPNVGKNQKWNGENSVFGKDEDDNVNRER